MQKRIHLSSWLPHVIAGGQQLQTLQSGPEPREALGLQLELESCVDTDSAFRLRGPQSLLFRPSTDRVRPTHTVI